MLILMIKIIKYKINKRIRVIYGIALILLIKCYELIIYRRGEENGKEFK